MTHSWPPPLSAIHTPGKAEQSKFPFPNKVRHSASCRNIPPVPYNMSYKALSEWGLWAEVVMPWWWSSSCVCASVPCLFPSYSLSRATQSACLGSRIDGGHRCLWRDVQMGWLLLRLLTDTLGHRQQWKVRELLHPLLLHHLTSPAEILVDLWGVRRPSLVHWPLVEPEDCP